MVFIGIYLVFQFTLAPLKELDKKSTSKLLLFHHKDTLYLSASSWGLAGNNEEIVLSKYGMDKDYIPNKKNDYIFYTSEVFYKIENNNSIILYAPESSISEPINKISNVKINSLKTVREIKDYNINYKKYELLRISVYN